MLKETTTLINLLSIFAVLLPDIFKYACDPAICDQNTRSLIKDVLEKLLNDYPKLYQTFVAKYDPRNQYVAVLENVLHVKRRKYNVPNAAIATHPDFDHYDDNYGNVN